MTTVTDASPDGEEKGKKSKPKKIKRYDERFLKMVPTQQRSRDRLKELTTAAEELFADPRYGRERTTTALIAERAGAAIGTVYRYFDDIVAILNYVWPNRRDKVMKPKKPKKKAKDAQPKDS